MTWRNIKNTMIHLLSSEQDATRVLDEISEKHERIGQQLNRLEKRMDPLEKMATEMRGEKSDGKH